MESGRVRHLALSVYSPERMREWFEVASSEGLTVPVAIQPQYNLIHRRDYEQDYAAIAADYDAAVFPFFGLASGVLTGKYRSRDDAQGKARQGFVQDLLSDDALAVVDALVEVAESRSVEPATIALAWLLAKGVTAPIASASTAEQLPALLAAPTVELTAAEVQKLDAASQPFA